MWNMFLNTGNNERTTEPSGLPINIIKRQITWVWLHMQTGGCIHPQCSGSGPDWGLDPGQTQNTVIKRCSAASRGSERITLTCCSGRMSLLSRLLSGKLTLDTVMSYKSAKTEILYGVTQSLIPNTLAWTTPFVIIGLKYKLSCTLAISTHRCSLYLINRFKLPETRLAAS